MKNWAEEIDLRLTEKLSGINEKDFRFYRIAEFQRMIKRTGELSANCNECQAMKNDIEAVVESIDKAIHIPGKLRRNYDRLIDRIAKHQRKHHGYFPPYFYTYNFSFIGMLSGTATGWFLGYLILPEFMLYFILSGFVTGLLVTRIWGARKDKKVQNEGKLL